MCNVLFILFTDEPCNVRKLCDGKVCSERGLLALFAFDADANVCGQDHAHVVATVADGCCCVARVLLHEADDGSLLCGRAAAADDGGRPLGCHEEVLAEVVEAHLERVSVDDKHSVRRGSKVVEQAAALFGRLGCDCLDDVRGLEQSCADGNACCSFDLVAFKEK